MTIREILLAQFEGDGRPLAEADLGPHNANTAYQVLYRMVAAGDVSSRTEVRESPRGMRQVVVYRAGAPRTDEERQRQAGAMAYIARKSPKPKGKSVVRDLLSTGDARDFTLALIWATAGRRFPGRA